MSENVIINSAATVIWMLVALVVQTAIIIVSATVLRKHRPDCWFWFAIAAGIELFWTIAGQTLRMVGAAAVSHAAGVSQLVMFNAALTILGALISGAAGVCVILGLLRIAKPANETPR